MQKRGSQGRKLRAAKGFKVEYFILFYFISFTQMKELQPAGSFTYGSGPVMSATGRGRVLNFT